MRATVLDYPKQVGCQLSSDRVGLTLPEFFEAVYLRQRLICASADTIEHYWLAVHHWSRAHYGLPVAAVTSASIAEFQRVLAVGRSAATVNSYTRPIMAILRFAADEEQGVLAKVPKVRKIPERKKSPLALTVEEFGKVLSQVATLKGNVKGCVACDWWRAVLLTAWESGLRFRALMDIRVVDLLWDDGGFFGQADVAKDREADWYPLQKETLNAIRKIYDPIREYLFPHPKTLTRIGKRFREILDASGIYAPRGSGMRFHRLRRSKASYTELSGGDAQRALGHSSRAITERYLDPRIVGRVKRTPMPMPV
jgi:integrase